MAALLSVEPGAEAALAAALGAAAESVAVASLDVAEAARIPARGGAVRARPALRAGTRDGDLLGAHWALGRDTGGTSPLRMRAPPSTREALSDGFSVP